MIICMHRTRSIRFRSFSRVFGRLHSFCRIWGKEYSMTDDALKSYLDEHIDDAQALLERLCRQPSVAAQNWGMAEMADLVESLLRETGFSTRRLLAEGAAP